MNALEVKGLSVEAGGINVVEGLDLMLAAGDKVGMVGRNGAGKTSTLKVLAGEDARRGRHGETPRRRGISPSGSTAASGRRRDERHRVSPRRPRPRRPATGGGEGATPARGARVGGARGSLRAARGRVRTKRRVSRRGGRASDRRGTGPVPGPADPPRGRALGRRTATARAGSDPVRRLGSACSWTNRRTTSMRTPRAG